MHEVGINQHNRRGKVSLTPGWNKALGQLTSPFNAQKLLHWPFLTLEHCGYRNRPMFNCWPELTETFEISVAPRPVKSFETENWEIALPPIHFVNKSGWAWRSFCYVQCPFNIFSLELALVVKLLSTCCVMKLLTMNGQGFMDKIRVKKFAFAYDYDQ